MKYFSLSSFHVVGRKQQTRLTHVTGTLTFKAASYCWRLASFYFKSVRVIKIKKKQLSRKTWNTTMLTLWCCCCCCFRWATVWGGMDQVSGTLLPAYHRPRDVAGRWAALSGRQRPSGQHCYAGGAALCQRWVDSSFVFSQRCREKIERVSAVYTFCDHFQLASASHSRTFYARLANKMGVWSDMKSLRVEDAVEVFQFRRMWYTLPPLPPPPLQYWVSWLFSAYNWL